MSDKKDNNFALVAIVGIVAIVAIVILFMQSATPTVITAPSSNFDAENAAGMARGDSGKCTGSSECGIVCDNEKCCNGISGCKWESGFMN